MTDTVDLEDLVAVPTERGGKAFGMSGAFYRKAFTTGRLQRFHIGSRVFFSRREMTALITVSGSKVKNSEVAA